MSHPNWDTYTSQALDFLHLTGSKVAETHSFSESVSFEIQLTPAMTTLLARALLSTKEKAFLVPLTSGSGLRYINLFETPWLIPVHCAAFSRGSPSGAGAYAFIPTQALY